MTAIIHHGEALRILQSLPDASVDAVITDPPYSSGGFSRDDKARPVADKYQQSGHQRDYPDFQGDSRDRIQAAQGLHVAQQDGLFEVAA